MSATICYPYVRNPIGGSFESVKLLINHLDRERYNTKMVFGVDGSAAKAASEANIPTDVISLPQYVQRRIPRETSLLAEAVIGIRLIPYLTKIRGYLRNTTVDIVHVNDGLAAVIWGLAARLENIPVIWHVRSEGPNAWDWLRLRLVNQLIFVAESNMQKFDSISLKNIDSTVIYNGVDINEFRPGKSNRLHEELGLSSNIPLVGFVGTLVARKRPMLFVNAGLKSIDSGCRAHFVIVGKDQGNFSQQIQQSVADAGVEDRFHILGYRNDIPEIMRSLSLLVLTSTAHGEAFPRVPLEAMASGTPVISTDTAGVSEAIPNDKHGKIVPVDIQPNVLGEKINGTIKSSSLLRQWSQNGLERIRCEFSADIYANNIMKVYRDLIIYN